jgi:hypothetical protein
VQANGLDAQRRFCGVALSKLVRLCADLPYIQKDVLPESNPLWLTLIPPGDRPLAPPPDPESPGTFQAPYQELMAWLELKMPVEEMKEKFEGALLAHVEGKRAEALRVFMHALLLRAQASPFHTEKLLARYETLLKGVCSQVCCPADLPFAALSSHNTLHRTAHRRVAAESTERGCPWSHSDSRSKRSFVVHLLRHVRFWGMC